MLAAMTPRQLKYFLRIAELGSFTKAASVLHIAQPALSRQVQQLESDLGVQLFVRSDTGVTLTDAGEALTQRAGQLLEHFASVQDEVSAMSGLVQGRLQFGAPPSLSNLIVTPLLLQYRAQYPDVALCYIEGTSSAVYELQLQGRLDMGVVLSTESMQGLQHRALFGERLFLAGAPGQFERDCVASLGDVAERPLMLTPRSNALRILLDDALRTAGFEWDCVMETNSVQTQIAMAGAGAGFTVLPSSAIAQDVLAGRLSAAVIEGLEIRWTLIHAKERALGTAAQRLVELLLARAHECNAEGRWPGFLPAAEPT
jgi:LysR family nitrogen assimilation transcriptional regulator